jgi:early secretory antigenic target protein ESAT-6
MSYSDGGGMLVNHASLDEAAGDLGQAEKNIETRLQHLVNELAPLQSEWEGNAQQAYNVAKGKWDAAISEMQTILAHTSTQVTTSNGEYHAADVRGANAFQIG